jgi:TatD DNase family protein
MPSLFDTHAHLDQEEFAADLGDVVVRAKAAGVESVLAVGVSAASSAATIELAVRYPPVGRTVSSAPSALPAVYAAVGIHPNYAAQAQDGDWERVVELARSPGVVALGETGLDRHWDYTPFDVQQDYFDRHLRLSQQTGLPVVIHTRDCDEDVLAMLRQAARRSPLRGIMHSFSGTEATAAECLALGLYVSFSGMVTYKKNEALRDVARNVPAERLLIETDSPYLSPEPVRSTRRNEPAHVAHTAARLATALGREVDEVARQTTANARRLFGLDV